jgi:two-component system, cell cycle response regulator
MSQKTVLVVEDNDLNKKLVKILLTLENHCCLEAGNAEEGIELARKHRPDLILMDIELPGMDGLTATRMIRQDPNLRNIPILALTAYAMEGDEAKAREAGCNGYITKPFEVKVFSETIHRQLSEKTPPVPSRGNGCGHRILIVDDEPLNVKLTGARLASKGYRILSAADGKEALELVRKHRPDLILLDIMMPGMDGYEVTETLKQDPEHCDIPIILVTALDGEDDKRKGLEAGADEFLNKPVNYTELEARVLSLIRLKQYQEQLGTRMASERVLVESPRGAPTGGEEALPRVLLVEDDDPGALLMEGSLDEIPCRVTRVRDGRGALEAVAREKIDVVLLSIVLPLMDGFEVCRRLKEKEETVPVQVVMVTSLNDLQNKIRGLEVGADDFLVKPITREELCARVKSLIRKKRYLDGLRAKVDAALQAAITDELTGIYNYAYFKHFLGLELKRSKRQNHSLALMMIDVDHFKAFNDTYGHPAGDRALRDIASVLRDHVREIDLAARYGGEEFAVVLPYLDGQAASGVAERLVAAVRENCGGAFVNSHRLSVSIGVSLFPHHGESMEDLIGAADAALYKAKRSGKNRSCVWKVASDLIPLETDLNAAQIEGSHDGRIHCIRL